MARWIICIKAETRIMFRKVLTSARLWQLAIVYVVAAALLTLNPLQPTMMLFSAIIAGGAATLTVIHFNLVAEFAAPYGGKRTLEHWYGLGEWLMPAFIFFSRVYGYISGYFGRPAWMQEYGVYNAILLLALFCIAIRIVVPYWKRDRILIEVDLSRRQNRLSMVIAAIIFGIVTAALLYFFPPTGEIL
jgi:hypothetical protein